MRVDILISVVPRLTVVQTVTQIIKYSKFIKVINVLKVIHVVKESSRSINVNNINTFQRQINCYYPNYTRNDFTRLWVHLWAPMDIN